MIDNFLSIPNLLTGLREGLEASLVVSILVAYVVKSGRRDRVPDIWLGVGAALALSLGFSAILQFTSQSMSFKAQEAFGGMMSIFAVALVTWMIFWMRRTARYLKAELEGKVAQALSMSRFAVTVIAFVSVGREGIETSLFLWASTQTTEARPAVIGIVVGLLGAAALGYLIYASAVRINLSTFFTYTSYGLVVVAAGVLAYGVHDLQEAGVFGGINNLAFDVSSAIPPTSWYGSLLKGLINFTPSPTWAELLVWIAYLVVVFTLLLWPRKAPAPAATPQASRLQQAVFTSAVIVAGVVAVVVVVSGTSTEAKVAVDKTYTVDSSNKGCDLEQTSFDAGKIAFDITNSGDDITEVYVFGQKAGQFTQIINEIENIMPGKTVQMTVNLKPGKYEVTCKPGMVDDNLVAVPISVGDKAQAADSN